MKIIKKESGFLKMLEKNIAKICEQQGVPYMDILCHQGDEKIFEYTFGKEEKGCEYLQMYSCSKPVTALATMILVERGQLCLDDAVEKYLPEISNAFLLNEAGEQVEPKNKMTVRHLLTMTAGFTYDFQTEPIREVARRNKNAKLRDFISAFVATPLSFEPGKKFQYSLCHDVLAAVIEVASGKNFSSFVQETIFAPLGMCNSFFDNRDCPLSKMYIVDNHGQVRLTDNDNFALPTKNYESGGGGLVCTIEDYLIFAKMLANGGVSSTGKRIVSENILRIMASEQIGQLNIENQFTCLQGRDYGYGFGVRVRKVATDWGLPQGEFGWDGAAGSYLMIDPINKVSIVMGMNVKGWPSIFQDKHLEIVKLIYEKFFT